MTDTLKKVESRGGAGGLHAHTPHHFLNFRPGAFFFNFGEKFWVSGQLHLHFF